jgi:large subunit ribosomal protein L25
MELQSLKAETRVSEGKGSARRVRGGGNVPAVLYGGGKDALAIRLNEREFSQLIHHGGSHAIVQLEVADRPESSSPALLKSVQYHPVRGNVLHADFQRIRLDERITTSVPIHFVGHCKGVVDGGVIDYQLREVEVECLALEVPDYIEIDITELEIGHSLHADALVMPAGVSMVTDPGRSLVAVHAPRVEKVAVVEEAPVEGEAAAAAPGTGAAGAPGTAEGAAEQKSQA